MKGHRDEAVVWYHQHACDFLEPAVADPKPRSLKSVETWDPRAVAAVTLRIALLPLVLVVAGAREWDGDLRVFGFQIAVLAQTISLPTLAFTMLNLGWSGARARAGAVEWQSMLAHDLIAVSGVIYGAVAFI